MDDLADRLNQIMAQRDLKASEIADATGITRPAMSRYLANRTGISAENLITLSQYLNVSPDWLLNGSDAPEAVKMSTSISVDKNTIIEVQRELIERLKKDVGRLEAVVKKTKNPTKPNKQKVGFMKKHKKSKAESNPAFDRMNKADQNAAKATRKRKI